MVNAFYASYYLLWILVLMLAWVVIQRSRQPAVESRLAMEDHGLPGGTTFPVQQVEALAGGSVSLYGDRKPTVVVYLRADCSACEGLYPSLAQAHEKWPEFRIVVLMLGDLDKVRQKVTDEKLVIPVCPVDMGFVTRTQTRVFPFAYLLDREGRIVAKGVVNSEEHVRILMSFNRRAA